MEMIQDEKYKEVLEGGLLLDHYFLLCQVKNGKKLINNKRIDGFINLLIKKGYLNFDNTLTEKGLTLVEDCGVNTIVVSVTEETTAEPRKTEIDFEIWALALHKKCQDKLYDLTKQRQVRAKIEKKSYSFIPNATDLKKVLAKTIILYKLKDYDKIESTILWYIKDSVTNNDFFPLLQYYILKNGQSAMVTDMQSNVNTGPDAGFKSNQKLI